MFHARMLPFRGMPGPWQLRAACFFLCSSAALAPSPAQAASGPEPAAQAHSPSAKPYPVPFAPPSGSSPPHPGAYHHEGFYLRLAIGPGFLVMDRSAETSAPNSALEFADSRITGFSVATEISVGGTPAPGIAVAGSFISHSHPGPDVERDDGRTVDLGQGNMMFVLMGGTVDWYPNPAEGFHAGGSLGVSYAFAPTSSAFGQIGGLGPALAGHIGRDFWISDKWSVGPSGRVIFAYITADHSADTLTASEDSLLFAVSVMLSAALH